MKYYLNCIIILSIINGLLGAPMRSLFEEYPEDTTKSGNTLKNTGRVGLAATANMACDDDEIVCPRSLGSTCIKKNSLCDGITDCPGSNYDWDELYTICTRRCLDRDMIQCPRDGNCILRENVCDGTAECADNWDESQCCGSLGFDCEDNTCVPGGWRCDGIKDCANGLDETPKAGCSCDQLTQFTCVDQQSCISKSNVCDLTRDCNDGSDEEECRICEDDTQFKCTKGNPICIAKEKVCDGWRNCRDASDELPEVCAKRSVELQESSIPCSILGVDSNYEKETGESKSEKNDCPSATEESDSSSGKHWVADDGIDSSKVTNIYLVHNLEVGLVHALEVIQALKVILDKSSCDSCSGSDSGKESPRGSRQDEGSERGAESHSGSSFPLGSDRQRWADLKSGYRTLMKSDSGNRSVSDSGSEINKNNGELNPCSDPNDERVNDYTSELDESVVDSGSATGCKLKKVSSIVSEGKSGLVNKQSSGSGLEISSNSEFESEYSLLRLSDPDIVLRNRLKDPDNVLRNRFKDSDITSRLKYETVSESESILSGDSSSSKSEPDTELESGFTLNFIIKYFW